MSQGTGSLTPGQHLGSKGAQEAAGGGGNPGVKARVGHPSQTLLVLPPPRSPPREAPVSAEGDPEDQRGEGLVGDHTARAARAQSPSRKGPCDGVKGPEQPKDVQSQPRVLPRPFSAWWQAGEGGGGP